MKYFDQQPLRDVGDFPDFGAAQYGEKDAVHHGSDTLTWTGMQEQSNRIGNRLAERLDESGTHIGIYMENNTQYLPIFYGIIKSGAIPVPMNYRLDSHSLEHIVEDAGIECLFGSDSFADEIAAIRDRSGVSEVLMVGDAELRDAVTYDDWVADSSSAYRQSGRGFDDIAYMLYTSGTTSNPKGVPYTHGNCLHTLELNSQTGAGDPEEVVQLTIGPCFHVYGLIGSKSVLYDGGTVVMRNRSAPEVLLNAITEFGVTEMGGVPTIYVNMINEIEKNPEQYDISSIRSLGTGAAPLANDTRDRIESAFGVILTEAWGMTETSVGIEEPVRGPRKEPGCIGYPLPGIEFKLVDPATRETRVPPAFLDPAAPANPTEYAPDFDDESTYTGEIATRGPNVFSGYHNLLEKNEAVFDGDGWFYTKDIARVDADRALWMVDRVDNMLIVGGENVYPAEVEDALFRNRDVQRAGVVAAPHETKGEAPVAFVVLEADAETTEAEIRKASLEHVPTYAHPRRVFFVDELPTTGSQKIQRHALERKAEEILDEPLTSSSRL